MLSNNFSNTYGDSTKRKLQRHITSNKWLYMPPQIYAGHFLGPYIQKVVVTRDIHASFAKLAITCIHLHPRSCYKDSHGLFGKETQMYPLKKSE